MGMDLEEKGIEEQLGGVERSETIKIYEEKKSIFNKIKNPYFHWLLSISYIEQ